MPAIYHHAHCAWVMLSVRVWDVQYVNVLSLGACETELANLLGIFFSLPGILL